jgi:HAD superfamily hydrolase (TIGR01450 family)
VDLAVDVTIYETVVFDLDGTLWLSGRPLPGAVEFVQHCRNAGAVVMAATNINIATAADVCARLIDTGLFAASESVMTSSRSIATAVRSDGIRRAAVLAGPGVHTELASAGVIVHDIADATFDRAGWRALPGEKAVVVGGWPEARLAEIETAGQLAVDGSPFYVTSLEAGFPNERGWQAGAGMMVAAARALHTFEPIVCGKPSARYAAGVASLPGFGRRVLVVGDSQMADVGLAYELGADSLLLTHAKALNASLPPPTFTASSLADIPIPNR